MVSKERSLRDYMKSHDKEKNFDEHRYRANPLKFFINRFVLRKGD